ncbi:MAG: hypothetical protein M3Q03_08165 [Chloroflexota bacterium]|nr:hypothetical protein [Chloroflexota bacterium]
MHFETLGFALSVSVPSPSDVVLVRLSLGPSAFLLADPADRRVALLVVETSVRPSEQ